MSEWDGDERRRTPHEYELRTIIRDELRDIRTQQLEMREAQQQIEQKIRDWETGASWFRAFVISAVGTVAALAAAWEWMRENLK